MTSSIQPSIETTSENGIVTLVAGEQRIEFESMADLSAFIETLKGLLANWIANTKFDALCGMKRAVANAIVDELRDELRAKGVSEESVARFPDGVVINGGWEINIAESGRGPQFATVTAHRMAKDLIAEIANAIDAGLDVAA